jgi:hypothetical protein
VSRAGGLVLRVQGVLFFLPAALVEEIVPLPQVTKLPGAPEELLGIALHRDGLVPVIAVDRARDAAIVCCLEGERLALAGAEIVATGIFDGDAGGGVILAGEPAPPFDLRMQYTKVQAERWGGHWG